MTPACAGLLESRGSGLGRLKSTFHAENFTCRLSVYFQPFWRNSLLKCVSQPKITKKFTKTPYFWVKSHSRSSMLTFLRSSSLVLVIISSMSLPICNHFHVRGANNGRIILFKGVPLFRPLVHGDPLYPGHEILSRNTRLQAIIW